MDRQGQPSEPNDFWFRRKTYGWGWTPCTWQGWLATAVVVVAGGAYPLIEAVQNLPISMPLFLYSETILIAGFIGLCYLKGEEPRWQWGDDETKR